MIKVAMIGAGSVVFSRNLTGDILGIPEFRDATISYMDIDKERLEVAANLCRKVAKALGANPTIETTTDRRKALANADFVINMVQIGGFNSTLVDFEIPRKYNLNFTIADTTGPGGLFRALRTYPMLSGMVKDMEQVCPRAFLLNYSNPMSMNMQTVFRTSSIRGVGLCHSVQGTFDQLMRYIGEDPAKIAFTCAGINHMAFYLKMEKEGVDLYPRLFKAMDDAKTYETNKVRFELMRRLGHFVTESSEHNAEYCPYFIPHGQEYIKRFDVPIDEYLRRCDGIVDEFDRLKGFSRSKEPMKAPCRSHEYGSTIMHSIVTGTPSVVYGNLPNGGTISNLPRTAIVEAPTLVDRTGLHHIQIGELPPQLVGYMQPHITQHELFIRAAMEGRRDHVYQACMFDPLTAATMPLDKIVEMCDEMIAAYGDELPKLDPKKSLVPSSGKRFPRVDSSTLRASWDAVQAKAEKSYIQQWKVLGAFPTGEGKISTAFPTDFEKDLAKRKDGAIDLKATYMAKQMAAAGGGSAKAAAKLSWKPATAGKRGFVDLNGACGQQDYAVAYAYTEVESIHARDAVLSLGSDDGIRVWINGEMVHDNDCGRGYKPDNESVNIKLKAGNNRVLVKVSQHVGGWGFGVGISEANF
ncbi:MAG: alpha-glucosidase/alpha-galactosidase [Planctomycetes bacterium]|nr:alpha-glucosidase/alpha-galactosidase [Planctomycetota bacterium]